MPNRFIFDDEGHLIDGPDTDQDELNQPGVRRRLADVRGETLMDQLNRIASQPLLPGQEGHNVTGVIDAWGDGPGSPFYRPGKQHPLDRKGDAA
jgi:hypothetical protein